MTIGDGADPADITTSPPLNDVEDVDEEIGRTTTFTLSSLNQVAPTLLLAEEEETGSVAGSLAGSVACSVFSTVSARERRGELVEIPHDVYNMLFVSRFGGQTCFYTIYIFLLKLALYTLLAWGASEWKLEEKVKPEVLAAQFLMIPVAVAMQEDLTSSFYLFANVKYSSEVLEANPFALQWKYHLVCLMRGIDGIYSLMVNFLILLKGREVQEVFLNFAALHFLQQIDDVALKMAADGFLNDEQEEQAYRVMQVRMPQKKNKVRKPEQSSRGVT